MSTAVSTDENAPKSVMAVNMIAVSPAAGPETLKCDLLKKPTTMPPTTPAIIPENKGAPEAIAMPRQSGNATRKTTNPDAKSDLRLPKRLNFFVIIPKKVEYENYCHNKEMQHIWFKKTYNVLNLVRRRNKN